MTEPLEPEPEPTPDPGAAEPASSPGAGSDEPAPPAPPPEIEFVAPLELDGNVLERRRQLVNEERAARHKLAGQAWRRIPPTFQQRQIDLLTRCDPRVRNRLGKVHTPTLSGLIIGPTGIGKTTALAWLVRLALLEFEQSDGQRSTQATGLLWTTAAEIALSERRHPLGSDKPPLLAQAISASLLVVDDIGLEPPGVVFEVLTARYDHCRPVLATSGLTKPQLTEHLGAAGVRRLTEQHAGFAVLTINAHDVDAGKGSKTNAGKRKS